MSMAVSPFFDAAMELASLGFAAVPLSTDRRPIEKGWPDAVIDEAATCRRFERQGVGGLAIVMKTPLFVLDLDCGHTKGVDGVVSFAELVCRHGGEVPLGPRVRSKRGGEHLYFRAPDGIAIRNSASELGSGIDVKGSRSCANAPPTPGYRWLEPICALNRVPIAPDWLVELVCCRPPPPMSPLILTSSRSGDRWAEAVLAGETQRVAICSRGSRNVTLFKAACRLGSVSAAGLLSAATAARCLLSAAEACGLTRDDGAARVSVTIANGLRTGAKTPCEIQRWRSRHG